MFVVLFFWMFWKFGGFLLTTLVGSFYRSGADSNAYFFAWQAVVYLLIFSRALKIIIPSFTPVFIEQKNLRGERTAWDFASTVLNLTLLGCGVMLLVVYVYAEPVTNTLVRGFSDQARERGIMLLKWMMPGAAMMVLFLPVRAILNSYKVFSYPAAAEAAQKLAWAVGLYVMYRFLDLGIRAVALGFLVGSAGLMCVSLFGLRGYAGLYRLGLPALGAGRFLKELLLSAAFLAGTIGCLVLLDRALPEGFEYRDMIQMTLALCAVVAFTAQLWLRARKRSGMMARFAALAAPLIVSTVFAAYRDVITVYFQSFTAGGVFSDIEYARRVAFLPTTMVVYALSVAMFPYLCELASRKDHALLGDVVTKALRMLALWFVPLTVMTVMLADPVSRLVFDRGDWAAVHLHYTALALALLALGLVVYAWEYVITQAYFSVQRMWTPSLMGIAATVFHFALLAVPIYVLGYDYPVHIFFLVALVYPASRVFKNVLLLALLRRHLPVLPGRASLVFAAKLTALSVAVGLATWFAHAQVRRRLPWEQYRQHKVVVDSFETGPDTWFSLNANDVGIVEAPGGGKGWAMRMDYFRHNDTRCSLYREMKGLRATPGMRLEFSLHSSVKMFQVAVEVEASGERKRVLEAAVWEAAWGGWQKFSCRIEEAGPIDRIHWLEGHPRGPGDGTLYLDDIRLVDEGSGEVVWSEDFDTNGWSPAGQAPAEEPGVENTQPEARAGRYALRLPPGPRAVQKDISGFDLSGTERFRCRLMSTEGPDEVTVRLTAEDSSASHKVELPEPDEWRTVDVSWKELGFQSAEQFQGVHTVWLEAKEGRGAIYVDDVTFRRPPSRLYELFKLLHCALPTLAGLIAAAVCLPLLKFEEVRDIRQWVKDRGWRRRREAGEEVAGGDAEP